MKQLLSKLTPPVVVAIAVAVLAALAAFGLTLSATQQGAAVLFVGAGALLLAKLPTVESIIGLATAGVAVAVAFGLPVTGAQSESIVILTGTIAALVLGKGAVTAVKAKRSAPARLATGRRPPKNAPALLLKSLLTGVIPAHPITADHFGKLSFGLYGNDRYGVCGPTSVANLIRLITGGLLGAEIQPSQEDVFDLYRRSGNPTFNPVTDAGDQGVDMQTMLEELLKNGIGDGKGGKVKPVAFAKVDVNSDPELEAAVAIFGGVLWGVNLETAQEAQTNATPPKWDFKKSGEWGGHAVLDGAYETGQLEDVISWALRVETTAAFRSNQLEEAWVVIFPWHLEHPAFQAGVDVAALAVAYKALTGKELVIPAPTPVPVPTVNPSALDHVLWAAVRTWALNRRHSGTTSTIAAALRNWAAGLGLS
jgi:hypothetical protein